MNRSAPLRRTPLKRSRRPINPFSAKRRKLNPERAKVVAQVRQERKGCEGMRLLSQGAHNASSAADQKRYVKALRSCNPWQQVLQPHEPLKRSRKSTGLADPDRIMLLCDSCAEFTESEVRLSTEVGLLIPSWSAR